MTINERIKMLRKDHLNMSAEKFGERLGVTRSAVTNVERGFRGVTDQLFTSICREFGVSAEWLRGGVGDPFPPKPRDQQIMDFVSGVMNKPPDAIERKILALLAKISPEEWDRIAEIAERIMNEDQ